MCKKFVSVFMAVVLSMTLFISSVASAAIKEPDVSPAYLYVNECSSTLSFSGANATCFSEAIGVYNVTTKIVIKQTLQKKNSSGVFINMDNSTWITTINSFHGSATNYKYSLPSATYRLKTDFTVYSGTASEYITKFSSEKSV